MMLVSPVHIPTHRVYVRIAPMLLNALTVIALREKNNGVWGEAPLFINCVTPLPPLGGSGVKPPQLVRKAHNSGTEREPTHRPPRPDRTATTHEQRPRDERGRRQATKQQRWRSEKRSPNGRRVCWRSDRYQGKQGYFFEFFVLLNI